MVMCRDVGARLQGLPRPNWRESKHQVNTGSNRAQRMKPLGREPTQTCVNEEEVYGGTDTHDSNGEGEKRGVQWISLGDAALAKPLKWPPQQQAT